MESIFQHLVIGASIGSIFLLIALGLAIIYGAMGVINMAHGEFIMLGAYGSWLFGTVFGLPLPLTFIIIFISLAFIGAGIETSIIRHLYRRPLDTILATWGIGVVLQQLVRLSAGGELRYVEMPSMLATSISLGGVEIPGYRLFILITVISLFVITWCIANLTSGGMRLRAVMQDADIASAFGINAARVRTITFGYGAGIAGLAGALLAPLKSVSPEMGATYVVDAFFVVVLGGIQSLFGTAASAFLIGQATETMAWWQNDTIAKAVVLVVIFIIIRFRPQGLFYMRAR